MSTARPSPIRVLDNATIDRIAAGEVIERPASVVKELVENALDAGARNLRIQIREGGLASISVEDDGHGIPQHDLPLACERHATSKIGSAADITRVGTYGFRGEALASIAAVRRLAILSRAEDEEVGGQLALVGGEIERREPAPRNRGTTVTVSDLFFNTPARRKYMGTPAAEQRAIVGIVTTTALACPETRWRLIADGVTLLDLAPVDSLPSRARDVLGPAVMEHMARFEKDEGGLAVAGLASRPTWTRGNRSQQWLFVNRRPIRSAALAQAIAQAYRDVIPAGRHPVALVFLQIPAGEVDVNVHPAKSEVRLLLERSVFALIVGGLRDGLNLRRAGPFEMAGVAGEAGEPGAGATPLAGDPLAAGRGPAGHVGGDRLDRRDELLAGLAEAEHDYLQRHFGGGGATGEGTLFPGARAGTGGGAGGGDRAGGSRGVAEVEGTALGVQGRQVATGSAGPGPALETSAAGEEPALRSAPFWQLHRTYICAQTRGGLVLIDQHNSHERILYNEAQRALAAGAGVPTQQLLFPVHLELSPDQVQAFQTCAAQLERLGFLIQPFGGQSVLVQGIPSSLKNWAAGQLLLDILDDVAETGVGRNAGQDAVLASFACHGAIRAGEILTVPEMQNLVDRLFATDLPLSCPHGRPTLIQFSLEELEKRFGRR